MEELDRKINEELAHGDPVALALRIKDGNLSRQDQLLLLQRQLVSLAGYDAMLKFTEQSEQHAWFMQWLLTDYETLSLFVTGGAPGNKSAQEAARKDPAKRSETYTRAFTQLMDLCRAYGDDIKPSVTADASERAVYRKMLLSAALGMDGSTRLWAGNADNPADPIKRYKIIRTFRQNHERYHFQKALFDALPVEEMRYIFENRIDDEELPWLVNYTMEEAKTRNLTEEQRLQADYWIYTDSKQGVHWTWDDPTFYNRHDIEVEAMTLPKPAKPDYQPVRVPGGWRQMYRFTYEDANFPNANPTDEYHLGYQVLEEAELKKLASQGKHPVRLWMVLQRGGVCGAVAKTHENLNGAAGVPATVCAQPGHAATIKYSLRKNKATGETEPYWSILNNMAGTPGYGWLELRTPESSHALCGWDEVHEGPWLVGDKPKDWYDEDTGNHMWVHWYGGPYTLLAQDVLNDFENYVKVFELRALADAQKDAALKMQVIEKAIEAQPCNQDALLAKCQLLEQNAATSDAEWLAFADQVVKGYAEHPLPMHSMLKRIIQKASAQENQATGNTQGPAHLRAQRLRGRIEFMRINALKNAMKVTEADDIQFLECQVVAKCLLDRKDGTAATFSFTGDDANKIKLGVQFKRISEPWQYSVDGGKSWVDVEGGRVEAGVSPENLRKLNSDDDLRVRMKDAPESGTITIDITVSKAPERAFANDNDNCFYTKEIAEDPKAVENYEALVAGTWVPLSDAQPFEGDVTVQVRTAAHGDQLASPGSVEVRFTDNKVEGAKHIPHGELRVNSFSSSQQGVWGANRVIDGWVAPNNRDGEFWHSSWSPEHNPWIIIDLGKERDITFFDFWRRSGGGNGTPDKIEVYAAPDDQQPSGVGAPDAKVPAADSFTLKKTFQVGGKDLPWDGNRVRLRFDEPMRARYIKLLRPCAAEDAKTLFSASELEFFEVDPKSVTGAGQDVERQSDGSSDAMVQLQPEADSAVGSQSEPEEDSGAVPQGPVSSDSAGRDAVQLAADLA